MSRPQGAERGIKWLHSCLLQFIKVYSTIGYSKALIKMRVIYLFTRLLFTSFQLFAQSSTSNIAQKPSEELSKELIKKLYDFTDAWAKSDTVTLSKMLAPEYRHSDVSGALQHHDDWLIYAANKREVIDVKMYNTEILLYHSDIAVITGEISYLWGANKEFQQLRFTQIWNMNQGQWKRVAFQGTYILKAK